MGQRRHHYERAFEAYLRGRRTPFVSVNEARKTLLPEGSDLPPGLKSFDYVIYGQPPSLLVEVKGRKLPEPRSGDPLRPAPRSAMQSWVTEDDITSLRVWESLFGEGFCAAFVFMYECRSQPPDGLFQEICAAEGRWYSLRSILLDDYVRAMRPRSRKWRTVDLPASSFESLSRPFCPGRPGRQEGAELFPDPPLHQPLSV